MTTLTTEVNLFLCLDIVAHLIAKDKRIVCPHFLCTACKGAHELCRTDQTVPINQERGFTRRRTAVELMGELGGTPKSVITATPSEGSTIKPFECPLCVDAFTQFSQLKWHLLSMHPRRERIMELVNERYGASTEAATSSALDSQHVHELSAFCKQTAGKMEPTVQGMTAISTTFKVPLKPRRETTAVPKMRKHQLKTRCKEFACVPTLSPFKRRSSWEEYLSFCLSNGESSEPVHKDH